MGLFINTNLSALNAQRQLTSTSANLSRSFERLSSGLRINGARDDAAGLSITTRFSAQIRGLNQAIRNSNDGISLAQTAEGALNETTNILQRIRELSVQSANDTNNKADRESIQAEVDQLKTELDRIATTTNFNGSKLLNGTFLARDLQVGANVGETISVSVGDLRTSGLARQVYETSTTGVNSGASFGVGGLQISNKEGGGFTTIRDTVPADDTLSTSNAAGSAIAKASAINSATEFTGVKAIVGPTTVTGTTINSVTLDEDTYITINDKKISGFAVAANDADGNLVDAINAIADETGVTASLTSSGQLELTAADGRNIEIEVTGAGSLGLTPGVSGGMLTLQSAEQFDIVTTASINTGLGNITTVTGTAVFGVNSGAAVSSLRVDTRENALKALEIVDLALEQVSAERADLGALQNRLESTINNLSTTSENLSASRSRIMDADFAQETATLSRNQILQQAGVSILSQANQQSQIALSLLG
jgi:flagellin